MVLTCLCANDACLHLPAASQVGLLPILSHKFGMKSLDHGAVLSAVPRSLPVPQPGREPGRRPCPQPTTCSAKFTLHNLPRREHMYHHRRFRRFEGSRGSGCFESESLAMVVTIHGGFLQLHSRGPSFPKGSRAGPPGL